MMQENTNAKQSWEAYTKAELERALPILKKFGYALDADQPHLMGERYLQHAVTTTHGRKLILLGKRTCDQNRVVIKVTSDPDGAVEIDHEHICRKVLSDIKFAYQTFLAPEELYYGKEGSLTIVVLAFIEQERPFLERPLKEQFMLALKAFKGQESAHATTYEHRKIIKKYFSEMDARDYVDTFVLFSKNIADSEKSDNALEKLLGQSEQKLRANLEVIEQYNGFLTHVDFVPHNFRVVQDKIYLLDHSSLRFGNKYEGWARFLNFMALYNPDLEQALIAYVRDNRTPEESLSLRLMRLYRLGEIIWYYINTLKKADGDLNTLNQKRITFWTHVLESVVSQKPISGSVREAYKTERDQLRSEDEKVRQRGLH